MNEDLANVKLGGNGADAVKDNWVTSPVMDRDYHSHLVFDVRLDGSR